MVEKAGNICPLGYKQTEVGVIPKDWEVTSLANVSSMKSGDSITAANIDLFSEYPCYGGNGLRGFTSRFTHDGEYALIGRQGALCGNVLEVNGKFFASEHAVVVTPFDQIAIRWLIYVLENMNLNQYSESSAQPGLSVGKILNLDIAVPSTKAEQEAIAEALSGAVALIESLEQFIAKKRQVKQGAMQELLTGKRRLPGFYGVWETKPFDEVLVRINAKAHQILSTEYHSSGQFPVVDQGKELITGYSHRKDKCFQCPEGGVIVFGDHTCIVKFINFNFIVGADGTQILKAKDGQNTQFYVFQLQHKGITPTGYNRHFKFLKEREFLVPSLREQTAIAGILSDMDTEIVVLEGKLSKARQIKQGMMQELLTGRIRLI